MVKKEEIFVHCLICDVASTAIVETDFNPKYPDDFFIECPHCSNTEEGAYPFQTFKQLKD